MFENNLVELEKRLMEQGAQVLGAVPLGEKRIALSEANDDSDITYQQLWDMYVVKTFKGLAKKTIHSYNQIWNIYLKPHIAHDSVRETTWSYVQDKIWDIELPSPQRHAHTLWKKMCNIAIREGFMLRNPVDSNIKMTQPKMKIKPIVYGEDVWKLLGATYDTRYFRSIILILIGGLRPEEHIVMRKNLLEYKDGFLSIIVKDAMTCCGNEKDYKGTKNYSSMRIQYIADPFASMLWRDVEKLPHPMLFKGPHPEGAEPNASWFPKPKTYTTNWKGWCDRNDVPYVSLQDMRTNYSGLHSEAQSMDSLVEKSMGHCGTSTRDKNYLQKREKGLKMIAKGLSDYLMSCKPKGKYEHLLRA